MQLSLRLWIISNLQAGWQMVAEDHIVFSAQTQAREDFHNN
jgi:hypothetical protein